MENTPRRQPPGCFRPTSIDDLHGIAVLVPVVVLANHRAQLIGAIWLVVGLVTVTVQRRRISDVPAGA